nr:tripartite motif-containing protein 10 isoform X2 [Oryctolagus cuniculus]
MAAAASVTSLADEVNCPICQGTLKEPVTIDCGHNFCRGCLTRYCEVPGPESEEPLSCPLCKEPFRPGSFRPNWQLASVVENIERLSLASALGTEEEHVCQEHGEKIYFFCEEDEAQLCVVCREAGEHRAHTVRFLEDAAGPYREQIQKCLKCLRREREEIQEVQSRENERMQVLLTQVATKRQQVISEFVHLRQFLEEQQRILLAQLEGLDGDILKQQEEFDFLVTGEICRFSALIEELEEKNARPARELLTDIRSTLLRCETRKCRKPEAVSPELGQRIRDFPQQTAPLQREMKMFLEKLCFELDYEPAHLALDPLTSHPKLLLSEDHQQARFSYKWQNSPDNLQRFDRATCVLARDGFTGGRHTWVEHIYTFTASFARKIFPFFGLWGRGSSFSLSS